MRRPFKIKEYLTAGLPMIVRNVPEATRGISAMSAGIVIDYKVKSAANVVIFLLSNQALLQTYKKNALRLVQKYLLDKIFNNSGQTIRILDQIELR